MTEAARLRITVLEAALEEIVEQADYFERAEDLELAARWNRAVHQAIQSVRVMPYRGSPCLLSNSHLRDVHRIPVPGFKRYSVFYRVANNPHSLIVIPVPHMARDVARILETLRP
jgi:plasmid stabilization system protein ParE